MAKIDLKFMKGNRELARQMGSTYTEKKKKPTTAKKSTKSASSKKK